MNRQQRRKAEREAGKGGQTAERLLALYALGAPAEEWREWLQDMWVLDSGPIIRAASVRGVSVPALFRAAQFPIPDDLPDEFAVWRAAWGDPDEVAKGLSWTPDRWAAFALAGELLAQGRGDKRRPVVVRRTIRRDQVVFVYAHRAEEVVFDAAPIAGEVDGTEEEWAAARLDVIGRCNGVSHFLLQRGRDTTATHKRRRTNKDAFALGVSLTHHFRVTSV